MSKEWMREYWRPIYALVYTFIVFFDFVLAPMGWSIIQTYGSGEVAQQWVPLTLGSGGFFHLASGGVLGVSSWTRGKEKIEQIKSTYGVNK